MNQLDGKFVEDFQWQAKYVPTVIDILGGLPVKLFTATKVAPREIDIKQNGDLVMFPFGGKHIAQRLRRQRYMLSYGLQFTIRTKRDSGAETELSKIRRGLGDMFFYGFVERGRLASDLKIKDHIRHWGLIDLFQFRKWATDKNVREAHLIDNHDGTYGRGFDYSQLPTEAISAKSKTLEAALAAGTVNVIEPLPTEELKRIVIYPPQLGDLIAAHGGYDLIPREAWAEWDRVQQEWQERHRQDGNAIYVRPDGSIENPNNLVLPAHMTARASTSAA